MIPDDVRQAATVLIAAIRRTQTNPGVVAAARILDAWLAGSIQSAEWTPVADGEIDLPRHRYAAAKITVTEHGQQLAIEEWVEDEYSVAGVWLPADKRLCSKGG